MRQYDRPSGLSRCTICRCCKEQHYPGEHLAIIDQDLWDRVQAVLAENRVDRQHGGWAKNPSLLAGLIHDGEGNRMTPTHAVKDGKRYRYYVSRPLITAGQPNAPGTCRIPAAEVEQVVTERLRSFLADEAAVFDAVHATTTAVAEHKQTVERAASLAASWATLSAARLRGLITMLVSRVEVTDDAVTLHLHPSRTATVLAADLSEAAIPARPAPADAAGTPAPAGAAIILAVPVRLARIGQGTRVIMNAPGPGAKPDATMVRLLAKAHQVQRRLLKGEHANIEAFAHQEQMTGSYIARLVRLAWLAPDITQAILTGRHPPALTAIRLMQSGPLPVDWQAQRVMLGFA